MSNTDRKNHIRKRLQDTLNDAEKFAEALCAEMSNDDYTAMSKAKYGILLARKALNERWGDDHE